MAEPSFPAASDPAFIASDDARPVRILAEYLRPAAAFRDQDVHDTIVFFGSARIGEDGPLGGHYRDARSLARQLTAWAAGLGCPRHRFVVCSGGGGGIMEAANRGAAEGGGPTIGLNISLPHEQRPNPWLTPGLSFEFRYFFMRKLWFAHLARAMVIFPGGFGTLDELFEVLTLAQTAKLGRRIPVLLYGSGYWKEIIDFDALARHGVIAAADLELLTWVDDPGTAFATLTGQLARIRCDEGVAFAPSRSSVNGDGGAASGDAAAGAQALGGCAACAARARAGA
jgi:uncharacterized protein (TIGR00730 family)